MEHIRYMQRRDGVDVGWHNTNLEPLNGVGRVGKAGIDKTYTLEQVFHLAYEIKANVIIKAGKNAKWYLKRFPINEIEDEIRKQQNWRDTSRSTMWIIDWI